MDEDASQPAGVHPGHRIAVVVVLVAVLVAVLWWTSPRMLTVVDSAGYLGAAENLRDGRGITTPFALATERAGPAQQVAWGQELPMSEWPPGYSMALATLESTGLDAPASARAISVLGLVVVAGAVLVLLRIGTRSTLVAVTGTVLVLVGPTERTYLGPGGPLGWSSVIASERLFLPLATAALAAAAWSPPARSRAWVLKVALVLALVPAAVLTRYLGVAVAVAAAVGFLVSADPSTRRRRLLAGGVLAAGAAAALLPGMIAGGSPKVIAWHARPLLRPILDTTGAWFHVPAGWPLGLRLVIVVVLLVGPVVWAALRLVRAGRVDGPGRVQLVLATFELTYFAAVIVTCLLLDAVVPPEQRILGPLQIAAYVMLVITVQQLAAAALSRTDAPPIVPSVVAAVAAVALAWVPLCDLPGDHDAFTALGRAQEAALGELALQGLPEGTIVFTDETSTVWTATGLPTYVLPSKIVATTERENAQYDEQVDEMVAILTERDGLAVVFSTGTGVRPDELEARGLVRLGECSGAVVMAAPTTTLGPAVAACTAS